MSMRRESDASSEAQRNAHRSSRSFEVNGQWYFELRGGGQKGPYESKAEMQQALNEFIQFYEELNQ